MNITHIGSHSKFKKYIDCKICHHEHLNNIENNILTDEDLLEYGITIENLEYHNNGHIKNRYKQCRGCKKIAIVKSHGFCSLDCLRKYDLELRKYKHVLSYQYKRKIYFNKYDLIFEPSNESETIFLFAKIHKKLGFKYIKTVRFIYPDCIAIDENNNEVRIEFEFKSSRFDHDINNCDLIICWENDWKEYPIKVISLKEFIKQ